MARTEAKRNFRPIGARTRQSARGAGMEQAGIRFSTGRAAARQRPLAILGNTRSFTRGAPTPEGFTGSIAGAGTYSRACQSALWSRLSSYDAGLGEGLY